MTTAKLTEDEKNGILSVEISGHSGYAEKGKDIVCAAISILIQAYDEVVLCANEDGMLAEDPTYLSEDGHVIIKCRPKDGYYCEAICYYNFLLAGLHMIALEYPDNLKVVSEIV